MDRVKSTRLISLVYFGFFLVLLTHCILALRLKRITNTLEMVQQNKQRPNHDVRETQWITNKIHRVSQRLDVLKDEVQDYHQRISSLKNLQ